MKKKLLSALLSVAMVSTLLVGCGSTAPEAPAAQEEAAKPEVNEEAEAAAAQEAADASGEGSVYYLNFKPEQDAQWQELAATYTEMTGVPVTVITAASNTYEETLKSEMAKTECPTLFQVNGPVGLATWKDYCYDLNGSDVYANLKSDDFALKDGDAVKAIAYVIETYGIIYNKTLLADYCALDNAVIADASEITSFDTLKAVADDIQARKDELGVEGAFTSAGMDSSSDWRFKTHLANLPIYYEYQARNIGSTDAIEGKYLDNYKKIWDLYITDSTCDSKLLSSKTGEDSVAEFCTGEAVFYQNGTWAYGDISADGSLADDELGMLPIFIGAEGEENQGLCTGSENYWCVNAKASEDDINATLAFLNWVLTSDAGRSSMANDMGFVTPFKSFDEGYTASNPLIKAADEYIAAGKTAVSWNFATIPSETWKDNVGSALLEYAQGTGDWAAVEKAFVEGWAAEYAAANN